MSAPDLDQIQSGALADVAAAGSLADLESVRVAHTGRRSPLATVLAGIGGLPPEQRGTVGKAANLARRAVEEALAARTAELEAEELGAALERDTTDVTLPGDPHPLGALHPITQVRQEMEDILLALGYRIADGPEIETEWHVFTALNTPAGHPSRSPSDTFFVGGRPDRLLRTQTSPVQVREMQASEPPIYLVAPGAVYRRDDIDATHSPMFHQMEGLAVDEGLTMAHLKGTMLHFFRELLGSEREILLQPHFFPFTEPSVDVQVSYTDKNGRPGWLELAGAGMVDPNVLAHAGIDSERYTGFAFGCGLDRIAMIRFGVPDLRLFFENDLRFLEQFA
ncbi:phenylalanine--tRNA ligase subunit alpha [Miltoncostaea oceani]|uniref:phenylalanine--tRNA ligase subunit alpha n=1 Tax=Miltoncostaea oceani TaxID=2843216 RepID=UPI001C3C4363|nr:phenylalanine--tRNA ligase subunit alpha [Miltoncostaea oceani]